MAEPQVERESEAERGSGPPCPVCGLPIKKVYVWFSYGGPRLIAYHSLNGDYRRCYLGSVNVQRQAKSVVRAMAFRRYYATLYAAVYATVRLETPEGPRFLHIDPVLALEEELARLCDASLELCENAVKSIDELRRRAEEVLRRVRERRGAEAPEREQVQTEQPGEREEPTEKRKRPRLLWLWRP